MNFLNKISQAYKKFIGKEDQDRYESPNDAFKIWENKLLNTSKKSPIDPYEVIQEDRLRPRNFQDKIPVPPKQEEVIREQIMPQQESQQERLGKYDIEPNPQFPPYDPETNTGDYYANRKAEVVPELYDVIEKLDAPDELKRLIFALAVQESSGGRTLEGDAGQSFGPYHIMPKWHPEMPKEKAMDFEESTKYVLDQLQKRQAKGVPYNELAKSWNPLSGYVNNGPKYDDDIPRMATTSAFLRGK